MEPLQIDSSKPEGWGWISKKLVALRRLEGIYEDDFDWTAPIPCY
jgi:hypothetical protein